MGNCNVYNMGLVEYGKALALQQKLHDERKNGSIPDVLLFIEHPPVITMGRRGALSNIVASPATLQKEGITVFNTGRGGDVTLHAPGQLIVYFILNMKENGLSVSSYVWNIEESVIRTLAALGIDGERIPDWRGVFVKGQKVCALGLQIRGGVSMHGLALNVNTDLKYFDYIVPCGLKGVSVTSIAKIKSQAIDMPSVCRILLTKITDVFGFSATVCEANTGSFLSTTIESSQQ